MLRRHAIGFTEVDISRDSALEREFGWQVPVVQVDGRTVYEAGMDPGELPGLIELAARGKGAPG